MNISTVGVTAILGPTNTGKTHVAVERMIKHESGMIGLPLRLLAREVYNKVVEKVGKDDVALITGEEKIVPQTARFHVCTLEAMPQKTNVDFVALDEVQLAADIERGHIFTDRILNLRGTKETLLLGATTISVMLQNLMPDINITNRARMSELKYSGNKKMTRLPPRCAIIAFTADEVYAIAELIRRQRGGACVVLGSLSPRTRNAQVELYQSGEVDFLIATDAIGMGLNLDLDHVAFAQDIKFDGRMRRRLIAHEFGQIAGRAGRHTKHGTFGVTGQVEPFEDKLVEQLEAHRFEPIQQMQWRNRNLQFDTIEDLMQSLEQSPTNKFLSKAPIRVDQYALDALAKNKIIKDSLQQKDDVKRLWEIAQIPDYRRIAPANHVEILSTLYLDLAHEGRINETWFAEQIRQCDNIQGGIDALSNRIAHIRTWTFVSYKDEWLDNAQQWQEDTRQVENRLSDALHERLLNRFVNRRTATLMKRVRENVELKVEISDGDVIVEGHCVGHLEGFRFTPQETSDRQDAKAMKLAASKTLSVEIERRAQAIRNSDADKFNIDADAIIHWNENPVAKLVADENILKPRVSLLADEYLTGAARDKVKEKITNWIHNYCIQTLQPLFALEKMAKDENTNSGFAKGLAFRLVENLGVVKREDVSEEIHNLVQEQRSPLRKAGVRFGAFHIFIPSLLKPATATLTTMLWALKKNMVTSHAVASHAMEQVSRKEIIKILEAGRTSIAYDETFEKEFYTLAGFAVVGKLVVRIDMLERLADFIRPLEQWHSDKEYLIGAWENKSFMITTDMLSILGATVNDMSQILKALGYKHKKFERKQIEEQFEKWNCTQARESLSHYENEIFIWYRPKIKKFYGSKKQKEGKSVAKNGGDNRKKQKKRVRPQEFDPASPFAKLAELKK